MNTLFGIKNCDTVKKARKWLEARGIDYHFHDFRADGLKQTQVKNWVTELGWEKLVNKRSTTWKQLDVGVRERLDDASVVPIILENPTLIKRPVLDTGDSRHVGFTASRYHILFS